MLLSPELREWLIVQFESLLENPYLYEWISAHLEHAEQRRVNLIVGGLQQFVSVKK